MTKEGVWYRMMIKFESDKNVEADDREDLFDTEYEFDGESSIEVKIS